VKALDRTFLIALALVCAACSSTAPKTAEPAPVVSKEVKLDGTNIAEAQLAGYKLVTKDGQKLYCRKDLVTGSHARYRTSCLTEQERQAMNENARQTVTNITNRPMPPQGK
jgi:hypothetical protein